MDMDAPPEVASECVPDGLKGLSAFALPKLLRFVLRAGLGERMVDYDQDNSQYRAMWDLVQEWQM